MRHGIVRILTVMAIAGASLFAAAAGAEEARFLRKEYPGGFALTEAVRFYDGGNLYEYINGQAVFYLSYGFSRLEHGTYDLAGKVYTVDVYELASPLSAFGSYRQQKDSDAASIDAGTEGSAIDYLCTFYKDRYYVEIIPTTTEAEDATVMARLAAGVAAGVPGDSVIPPEVGLFPGDGLIQGSERYVDENLLSYAVMGRGLTAEYTQGDDEKPLRVFIAMTAHEDSARAVYDGFAEKLVDTEASKAGPADGLTGNTPYRGPGSVYRFGRYVVGCLAIADETRAVDIISGLLANIESFGKKK